PAIHNSFPLQIAAAIGNINIVKLLLEDKRADPADYFKIDVIPPGYSALPAAIGQGHLAIVKLLLMDERDAPYCFNNLPLFRAITNGNCEIIKLLLKDTRVNPAQLVEAVRGNNYYPMSPENKHVVPPDNNHAEALALIMNDAR